MLLLGHWLPKAVYLLLTSCSSSSLACSLGIVQTPAASSAVCHCIILGFAGLRLACNICAQSHSPTLLNLHCNPVRPLPMGTSCRPVEEVCRCGTALNVGLHAIRPQIYPWLDSIYMSAIIRFFLGPEVKF